jgi:phenylpropionate dioxygenase-like ring-hydroxylating dioxygenase large terminal subunit
MSYLQQAWYVAAFSSEIGRKPLSRMLLGQPVVLYRTQAGTAVALSDVCPHRRAPLHRGTLFEDTLACPYHGLRFDPTGACVHNPNFNNPPPAIRAKTFPVVERDDMIWVWMGDPADADPSTVLTFDLVVASERVTTVQGYLHIRAAEPLISDNLLDLSHAEFLHPFLANPGFNTRLLQSVHVEGDSVLSNYAINDEPLTPILAQLWAGTPIPRADMRFEMRWNPPSCLLLEIGATRPGRDKTQGVTAWVSHLLTPETESSTHYFWAFARDSKLKDEALSSQLRAGISQAFMSEDAPIIEWQQRYDTLPGQPPMRRQTLPGDLGGARARRIVERLLTTEGPRNSPSTLS